MNIMRSAITANIINTPAVKEVERLAGTSAKVVTHFLSERLANTPSFAELWVKTAEATNNVSQALPVGENPRNEFQELLHTIGEIHPAIRTVVGLTILGAIGYSIAVICAKPPKPPTSGPKVSNQRTRF